MLTKTNKYHGRGNISARRGPSVTDRTPEIVSPSRLHDEAYQAGKLATMQMKNNYHGVYRNFHVITQF